MSRSDSDRDYRDEGGRMNLRCQECRIAEYSRRGGSSSSLALDSCRPSQAPLRHPLVDRFPDRKELLVAKKDAVAVMDALGTVIELHVKARGPGKFTLPGLLKINVVNKPARKAREGINPFTGEKIMFKAKPAHKVVKIKALRKLKEMAI